MDSKNVLSICIKYVNAHIKFVLLNIVSTGIEVIAYEIRNHMTVWHYLICKLHYEEFCT